ncbi:MAG: hypothetical protein EU981_02460 [Candidatus Liberibacter ctenarytainae]|uniref:Uncharacterized protein n=1 Tax=Candidatus Liberibacter ctenarytainae TaxID=2020335 RepID=A0A937ARY4_9HYPH|nr:hypothetical protein [Candidatus Liberibacter ctenarytainae]
MFKVGVHKRIPMKAIQTPFIQKSLIFDGDERAMTPSHRLPARVYHVLKANQNVKMTLQEVKWILSRFTCEMRYFQWDKTDCCGC